MSHEEFSKLIGPYLDGELSAEEREKVENCLADSAECRQMASELEELDRVARGDSPPAVSDDEWQEVLSSVRRTEKIVPFETVKSRRRWLAPLAGLAALLCIGLFLRNAGDSPPPKKDWAEATNTEDEPRVDTIDSEEKEEENQENDPRFDEE
ncbi:MAG: zf-HC2 domain-containing protein [Planctomycetota bacterium]